ncbi:MAG: M42 family metallopeptidase [Clostridiales bacterium]|nr:M42 family metallopeptidase [Clostridiales bacterium]
MKETLKTLCAAYGASGNENGVALVIRDMIAPYVDEIREDALGNLIAVRRGAGKRVMLAAHMDQIGFVVTDIEKEGFLRVHNVGGIRKLSSVNRRVVFESGLSGALSVEEKDHDPADATMLKLFIDIGATSREQAETMVRRGDMAVYSPDIFEMGDFLSGPAMDNRAGCALLVEALKALSGRRNEVVAVFTTQEEVGLRGARAAAWGIEPDVGIALDVTGCGDTPNANRLAIAAGDGIAIKVMDMSLICTPAVVAALERAAERAGAKYQREVLTFGGTDAGAIQQSRGGVPAGLLSIPCRYVHSAVETVNLSDMREGVKLLVSYLENDVL